MDKDKIKNNEKIKNSNKEFSLKNLIDDLRDNVSKIFDILKNIINNISYTEQSNNSSNKKIYLKHDNNFYEYTATEENLKLEIKQILDNKTSQDSLGKIKKENNHCRLVDFLFNQLSSKTDSHIKKRTIDREKVKGIQIPKQIPLNEIDEKNSIIIEFDKININFSINTVLDFNYQEKIICDEKDPKYSKDKS